MRKNILPFDDGKKCPECAGEKDGFYGPCLKCIEQKLKNNEPVSLKHLPEFWVCDEEIRRMASDVAYEHHPEIAGARIIYMFRKKHSRVAGAVRMATCAKQSAKHRLLHGYDFVIEIAFDLWCVLEEYQRNALLLHELSHIMKDETPEGATVWKIVTHDVEEFTKVIETYGLWQPNIAVMAAAVEKCINGGIDEHGQMSLFQQIKEAKRAGM